MGQSFIIAEAESSCGVAEVPGVTHIVYPFGLKGDPDDGQEYLRCLEKRCPVVCSSPSNHVELCILEDSCKLQALASAICAQDANWFLSGLFCNSLCLSAFSPQNHKTLCENSCNMHVLIGFDWHKPRFLWCEL